MASSSQSGSGFQEISELVNVYDIFKDVDTIADSLRHTCVPVYPETGGQNLTNYNGDNTAYVFNMPNAIVYGPEVFYTVDGYIVSNGARKLAYNTATAATKVAIQNNTNSLFNKIEISHNGVKAEVITEPGKVGLLSHLNNTEGENRMFGPSDYTYLNRGKVFDGAGGAKYATTFDTPNYFTVDNITDYDESFEERCKRTTSKISATDHEFQLTGKLPLGAFTGRQDVATYYNKTQVILYRNSNANILENRTGGLVASVVITNITLWVPILKPTLDIMSHLQTGIATNSKQKIAYKHIDYFTNAIPISVSKHVYGMRLGNIPANIIVGFQISTDKNLRSWSHQDIGSVVMSMEGIPIPEDPLVVTEWTNKKDSKRLYELFLMSFGQHNGTPAISFEQFTENYCLWCFDTSSSITGVLELNKKPVNINFKVTFNSSNGLSTAAMDMDVFVVSDKLYTIEGPSDLCNEIY